MHNEQYVEMTQKKEKLKKREIKKPSSLQKMKQIKIDNCIEIVKLQNADNS